MAERKTYTIGAQVFKTQTSLRDCIREIVSRYADGATLLVDDHQFILGVLEYHQDRDKKIGVGVRAITIESNVYEGSRTRGFWITRVDGSRTDFSWVSCLKNRTAAQDARDALRQAIQPQLKAFKDEQFRIHKVLFCPYTGLELSIDTCHVDHIAPETFDRILREFLDRESRHLEEISVKPSTDGMIIPALDDEAIAERWIAFHGSRARLRLLSPTANLSHAKRSSSAYQDPQGDRRESEQFLFKEMSQ